MDTLLKPARLDLDPNSPSAAKEWTHWHKTFTNFLTECGERAPDKYRTLINYVSHNVYEHIEDCTDYESALKSRTKYLLDIYSLLDGKSRGENSQNLYRNSGDPVRIVI